MNEKLHLFSYDFRGDLWSLEIRAASRAEAELRLSRMATAQYDGEVFASVYVPTTWIGRLCRSIIGGRA